MLACDKKFIQPVKLCYLPGPDRIERNSTSRKGRGLDRVLYRGVSGFYCCACRSEIYALFFAKAQIEEMHNEAQVEHLLTLVKQYDDEPMVTYRKRLAEQRLKSVEEPDDGTTCSTSSRRSAGWLRRRRQAADVGVLDPTGGGAGGMATATSEVRGVALEGSQPIR